MPRPDPHEVRNSYAMLHPTEQARRLDIAADRLLDEVFAERTGMAVEKEEEREPERFDLCD